jgi:mRNA interferase MazF
MGKFVKGDVIVVPFPFSDLSANKRRPALVIASLTGDDVILCQITSKTIFDDYAIALTNRDFQNGSLNQESNLRPNRIFTADSNIALYRIGTVKSPKLSQVTDKIIEILKA